MLMYTFRYVCICYCGRGLQVDILVSILAIIIAVMLSSVSYNHLVSWQVTLFLAATLTYVITIILVLIVALTLTFVHISWLMLV